MMKYIIRGSLVIYKDNNIVNKFIHYAFIINWLNLKFINLLDINSVF